MPHISLAAETLWRFGILPITNSLLTTWLVMGLLFVLAFLVTRNLSIVPGKAQSLAELVIGGLYDFFGGVAGKHVKYAFPLLASLFLFIIVANWVGLLPGVGTIGYFREKAVVQEAAEEEHAQTQEIQADPVTDDHAVVVDDHDVVSEETAIAGSLVVPEEHATEEQHHTAFVPLLRGATADLNMTLALAIVAVLSIQYYGFKKVGPHYGARFIDLRSPIYFFVGVLEIISDTSKILSFAFRLFGNIFAGEVLLAVIAFLLPFIVPLPFLTMELFVGFVQALVFSMLTAVFLSVSLAHGEGEHTQEEEHAHS